MMRPNGVEKQVRPSGWKPGANTIAYYPLTSTTTVNDLSGNNYNLTNNGCTFNSNSALIGNNLYLYRNTSSDSKFITGSSDRTYSMWLKLVGTLETGIVFWQGQNSTSQVWSLRINSNNYGIDTWGSGQGVYSSSMYSNYNNWHLITTTYDNGIMYLYLDGVLVKQKTQSVNTSKSQLRVGQDAVYNDRTNAYISDFIIENKARTAQEVLDYYNLTKGNYGL